MKILHTITGLHVGGAENMLAKLIEAGTAENGTATKTKLDPVVLSMMTPGSIADRIKARNVPLHTLGMREGSPSLSSVGQLVRQVRAQRPDMILGWMHHGALAATLGSWSLRSRPPVIWNIRHSLVDIGHEKPMTRALLRLAALLSGNPAAIVYNAQVSARQYEAFGFPAAKSIVIPNGFDCDQYQPRPEARELLRKTFGIDNDAVIVAMVARHHPMKDPAMLARAVKLARDAGNDLHLLMVGKGANTPMPELAQALAELPQDRVTLSDVRNDVAAWLPGVDVVALSSAWGEGFPNIIGEAMACGLPCVATDIGDSRWIVDGHGWIVPPLDSEGMARALGAAARMGHDTRKRIGAAGRARVLSNFSLDQVARQYDDLYERVLGRAVEHAQWPTAVDTRTEAA